MFISVTDDNGDSYVFPLATVVLHTCDTDSVRPTKFFVNGHRVNPNFYDKILMKIEQMGIIE